MANAATDRKKRRSLSQPPATAAGTVTNPRGGDRKGGGMTIPGSGVSVGGGRDRGGATTTQTGPRSFDLTLPPGHGMTETTEGWQEPDPRSSPDAIPGVGPGVETALQAGGEALSRIPGAIADEARQFQDYAQDAGGGGYGYGQAIGAGFRDFGQQVAEGAQSALRPIGEGFEGLYGFGRGVLGLPPATQDQPEPSPDKGPAQESVEGPQERTLPGGETYYENRDVDEDKYGKAIFSGTKEGATPEGFDATMASGGYGVSDLGGGEESSRGLRAPPLSSARLDAARTALDRGNTARAGRLLQSPQEAQAEAERRQTADLPRQASQHPSLSMPFGQLLQTTAERNAAQDQLRTQAKTRAAETKAAQDERESRRQFMGDLIKARISNRPQT